MHAIHLSSKLHPSAYRSVTEMVYTQEMQRVDRELHLELSESPINPAFIHMSSPIQNGCDPLFYLKINGEALWKCRELKSDATVCRPGAILNPSRIEELVSLGIHQREVDLEGGDKILRQMFGLLV